MASWAKIMAAEYLADLDDRLSKMTPAGRQEFMRWFVGDREAKVLARRYTKLKQRAGAT